MHVRDKGNVDKGKVLVSHTELELTHSFDEGGRFNITNCSSELQADQIRREDSRSVVTSLDDANVWLLIGIVNRDL
jgi:hypothetical protein